MDHWKNGSEEKRSLRDLVLEEDVENQMNGKSEKRGGIQKNREDRTMWSSIRQRRTRWVGHVIYTRGHVAMR
jgi:hypothetical protein